MRRSSRRLTAALAALAMVAACSPDGDGSSSTAGSTPIGSLPGTAGTTVPGATTAPGATTTLDTGTTVPPTAPVPDPIAACVQSWPLRDRIAMLVWPAVYSNDWNGAIAAVRDLHLGGVILMKPSDSFAQQLAARLGELDAVSPHGLLVATDEEGGVVQRLRALGAFPSQEEMSGSDATTIMATIQQHAQVIQAAGIDVVLGPVVDVRPEQGSDPLGDGRLFVGGPEEVATLGGLYVQGWQSAGLLPVLKHFPGHGSASTDTHQGLATTPPLDELRARDLVPYQRLAGSGAAVMVGHLDVPGLTNGEPASRSAAAIALLRGELGYADALVMTDALGMGGVGLPVTEAAVRSVRAGVDVVIFTGTADAGPVIDAITAAVADGSLTEAEIDDSAIRVARAIAARGTPCTPAA